uniref:Uncharacterized protein n=1 Tax=Astyanax mexicanus TaxID=7994 RepID=A0A3B1IRG4_ASTMX
MFWIIVLLEDKSASQSQVYYRLQQVFFQMVLSGRVDLAKVKVIVNEYSGTLIPLANPKSYHVRVCGQKDTVYAGNEDQLEAWEDHYLSERMTMTVIGAIDDFPCEAFARQLVLLLCEDGNIYTYEDEVVHLVAESLKDLLENGMTFPGSKSYNLGECFEEYTEEEYEELMECSEMKKMREEHEKFRESLGRELLECLEDLEKRQFKVLPGIFSVIKLFPCIHQVI